MTQKKIKLNVPYIGDDQFTQIAQDFLKSAGQSDEPPVDIEHICDSMGIAIHTVPRLKRDLGIDAYIRSDFKSIVIDADCFERHERRARFSLAHELAHMVMHRDIYQQFNIQSLDDYLEKQNSLHPDTEKRIEYQAHTVAGLILVPPGMMKRIVEAQCSPNDFDKLSVTDVQKILVQCAEKFFVSDEVVLRRFKRDYPDLLQKILLEFDQP